jgi:hypothetical protein
MRAMLHPGDRLRPRPGWHGALKFLKIINKRADRSLSRTAPVQRFAIAVAYIASSVPARQRRGFALIARVR